MSLSDEGLAQPDAEQERYSVEPANGLLHNQPQKQLEPPAQPQTAAPLARGTAKTRKAHKGFEKLLSAAGVWEVAKASSRSSCVRHPDLQGWPILCICLCAARETSLCIAGKRASSLGPTAVDLGGLCAVCTRCCRGGLQCSGHAVRSALLRCAPLCQDQGPISAHK